MQACKQVYNPPELICLYLEVILSPDAVRAFKERAQASEVTAVFRCLFPVPLPLRDLYTALGRTKNLVVDLAP